MCRENRCICINERKGNYSTLARGITALKIKLLKTADNLNLQSVLKNSLNLHP